jgi:hypothetical protein
MKKLTLSIALAVGIMSAKAQDPLADKWVHIGVKETRSEYPAHFYALNSLVGPAYSEIIKGMGYPVIILCTPSQSEVHILCIIRFGVNDTEDKEFFGSYFYRAITRDYTYDEINIEKLSIDLWNGEEEALKVIDNLSKSSRYRIRITTLAGVSRSSVDIKK